MDIDSGKQLENWKGQFGVEYTMRNMFSGSDDANAFFKKRYGSSLTELNEEFLGFLDKERTRVLEVGCNIGYNLQVLQDMGFKDLWGIEVQDYAVEIAKQRTKGINIIKGSAYDIPFKDEYFDIVFTKGVLIHIPPKNLEVAMNEIARVSKKYIFGLEYFNESGLMEIPYRGNREMLWKGNYPQLYKEYGSRHLREMKSKLLAYLDDPKDDGNRDIVYLLEKHDPMREFQRI